jgi:hypothetical protein
MRRVAILASLLIAACSKADAPRAPASSTPSATVAPQTSAGACPATGEWSECQAIYRLERAGVAPKVDSTAKPREKALSGRPLVLKIGINAQLELFFYADSAARVADAAKLDRKALVSGTAPQTMKRERTLIESANLVGLLTSINAHQRERVSDALTAGPPQPSAPVTVKPSVTTSSPR